jgi:hypothetical protein
MLPQDPDDLLFREPARLHVHPLPGDGLYPFLEEFSGLRSNPETEMSVDLLKGITRFLQICRIDDNNRIHIATQREQWPIDSLAFPVTDYIFKIGIKGEDSAETCFYSVKLRWNGNWTTAEMMAVPVPDD